MEASALHAPARIGRLGLTVPLLRLRSDEQLVALFRAGSDEAFTVIHDRFRQRLFAYVRQMLSSSSRPDAEDVLQDVFVRAYGALRADERDVNLKAWLYRVAHNRCIDHLRRPTPPAGDVFAMSRTPLLDPIETAQRRDDLRRLVEDVGRLPEQQRSALLMREIDGLPYAHIAAALDVTVPAVKSLLVRARVGLVEAIEARDTDCAVIRGDLAAAYDRGVKASGRARKHMRECAGCREYRGALREVRKSFAALSPVAAAGPIAFIAKALGGAGAGSGAAAGGGAAVGGGGATLVGAATACKVAAVVCTAALTAGAGIEATRLAAPEHHAPKTSTAAHATRARDATAAASHVTQLKVTADVIRHRTDAAAAPAKPRDHARRRPADPVAGGPATGVPAEPTDAEVTETTGGAIAPSDPVVDTPPVDDPAGAPASGDGGGEAAPAEEAGAGASPASGDGSSEPGQDPGSPGGPPSQH